MLGAFDGGSVVCVQTRGSFRAGHFTVAYFDETPVQLGFSVPAEEYEAAGAAVLQDQLRLARGYAVPYGPNLQEQQPDAQSESAILEMTRQPGEKKPEADQKNGARFANP